MSADKIALYRKYRPSSFETLVGQDHIRTTLLNAFKEEQVAHAYLLCGPRGTGKTSTARLIAKGLNCLELKENGEPCNQCEMCTGIKSQQLMDIIEIDAASNRGIDEIRDLRDKIKFSPSHSKKKVFIIDEVHMLTKEAFNALLKTLEEPPAHAHLILATTERHKVPATIVSRCQHFDFKRIDENTIISHLSTIAQKEKITVENHALNLIAKASDGSMRDAIGLLEQMSIGKNLTVKRVQLNLGLVDHHIIQQFSELLLESKTKEALKFINDIYTKGINISQAIRETKEHLRNIMLEKIENNDHKAALQTLSIIKKLEKVTNELKISSIPLLPIELMLVELGLEKPIQNITTETKDIPNTTTTKTNSTKLEESNPISKDNNSSTDLSIIREHWGKILNNLSIPSAKLALHKAKLQEFSNNTLTIHIYSSFELDKVDNINARNDLKKAIETILKNNIDLNYHLAEKTPEEQKSVEKKVEINTTNPVQEVVKVFNGKIAK